MPTWTSESSSSAPPRCLSASGLELFGPGRSGVSCSSPAGCARFRQLARVVERRGHEPGHQLPILPIIIIIFVRESAYTNLPTRFWLHGSTHDNLSTPLQAASSKGHKRGRPGADGEGCRRQRRGVASLAEPVMLLLRKIRRGRPDADGEGCRAEEDEEEA